MSSADTSNGFTMARFVRVTDDGSIDGGTGNNMTVQLGVGTVNSPTIDSAEQEAGRADAETELRMS